MSKVWAALMTTAMAATAVCQAPPVLYEAVRGIKDQNITLKAWGSGTIAETDDTAFEGTHSIRISTRNFFQGGLLSLAGPVDLAGSFTDKNNLLRIMVSVSTSSTTYGGGSKGGPGGPGGITIGGTGSGSGSGSGTGSKGGPGGNKGSGPGGPGGQGNYGGSRGGPGSGMAGPGGMKGGPGGLTGSQNDVTPLSMVRVIILTTDGKRSEAYVPLPAVKQAVNGFLPVAIPLQAISGFDKTNKIVKEIGLSGDAPATFYVGNISVWNDATPITGDVNYRDLNLALNDEVNFAAIGFGGASILKYTWNFGLGNDPSEPDAEGQWVTRKFRKPGDFVVTLTISDKFGLKKPYSTTIKVRVNP